MHRRLVLATVSAAAFLASVTACGGSTASVFRPAGAPPSASAAGSGQSVRVTTAPGGYRFPAGVSVDFAPATSGSATDRAVLTGYQDYALDLWAAVTSGGRDPAYRHQASGDALAFTEQEIAYFSVRSRAVSGTISYSGATVAAVYFGTSAEVTSCVDTSGFHVADAHTGAVMGSVFPPRYAHYLENVAEARRTNGTWYVSHTESYPASTPEGAACQG